MDANLTPPLDARVISKRSQNGQIEDIEGPHRVQYATNEKTSHVDKRWPGGHRELVIGEW